MHLAPLPLGPKGGRLLRPAPAPPPRDPPASGEPGPEDTDVIDALSVLSSIYQDLHQCDAALATAREVVQRYTAVRPMTDQGTLIEVGNLGFVEYDCGDLPNSIVHLTQAEQGLVDHYGDGLAAVQVYRVGIAKALRGAGSDITEIVQPVEQWAGIEVKPGGER